MSGPRGESSKRRGPVALTAGLVAAAIVAIWFAGPRVDARPNDAAPPDAHATHPAAVDVGAGASAPAVPRSPVHRSLRARIVLPDGTPLGDCGVRVRVDDAPDTLHATSDRHGRLELLVPATGSAARVDLDWGPEPQAATTTHQRIGDGAIWDLGDLTAPAFSLLRIVPSVDDGARAPLAALGAAALWFDVAMGIYPNLPALMAARQEGRVRRVVAPLGPGSAAPDEQREWFAYDGPLQVYAQLEAEQTAAPAPIERRVVPLQAPGHYAPLTIALRSEDFVRGTVAWSDGAPAAAVVVEARSDQARNNGLPGAKAVSGTDGAFTLFAPGGGSGQLVATAGRARFEQPYAAGIDNRIELPLRREAVLMVRIVGPTGQPVARGSVFQLNRIHRSASGAFDAAALLEERAPGTPGGLQILAVARVARGERWYVTTPEFGEVTFTFERDCVAGTPIDVLAAGNGPPPRTVRIELPVVSVPDGAMLTVRENSPRGDRGARYWLRCAEAFQRGFVELEHVFPGVHTLEVSHPIGQALPELRVD